ncbi:hypothetical protein BDV23DRAFT_171830 [Aspergillus alliaceus]|uniref:RelA/SpoT domain-containing protein n=1 Tax=Petromyces alliaceus TaxID=209559 RepID=A0A5N7CBG1_PETAA|nr:hypothetical protein BDV23DRAFT_171830 [Aspergillus alliaceus]
MSAEVDNNLDIIDEFMSMYNLERTEYSKAAKRAKKLCEDALRRESVECLVTCRAKEPDSLRTKLVTRQKARLAKANGTANENNGYRSIEDIKSDIPDLAGVRIALYIPRKKEQVKKILQREFAVQWNLSLGDNENQTCDARSFPGYCADHYRVFFREDMDENDGSGKKMIEIQVVSVLRHAWAEVQHDLVYKQLVSTTREEIRMLDALSSMIYSGDCVLDHLFDSQSARNQSDGTPFKSVYQLGSLLSQWIERFAGRRDETLGDVESLWKLLMIIGLDSPKQLWDVLSHLDISVSQTSDYTILSHEYDPLQLSITNYVMHRIIRSSVGQCRVERVKHTRRTTDNENKYKLCVVANAFIRLDHFFSRQAEWFHVFYEDTSDKHKVEIKWLSSGKPQQFYNGRLSLNVADQEVLDGLWLSLEGHDKEPIKFAFNLSLLEVTENSHIDWTLLDRSLSFPTRAIFFAQQSRLNPRELR